MTLDLCLICNVYSKCLHVKIQIMPLLNNRITMKCCNTYKITLNKLHNTLIYIIIQQSVKTLMTTSKDDIKY